METDSKEAGEAFDLEGHLGYWLRRVSNAVSGAFSRALQERQTSVAEWVLLREINEREQAVAHELAETLGLTRGAVSKIVDKLEAKDWVRSSRREGDSRSRLLRVTGAGRRNLPVLAGIADRNDARFFDCLSAAEKDGLRGLLLKVIEHNGIHQIPTE